MSITWKLGLIAAGALFVVTMVLGYNHAIKKAEDLSIVVQQDKEQINQLQAASMQQATNLKNLSETVASHDEAIAANTTALSKRTTYINKAYAGATDVQKNVLDTHLPQFKCVFARTCEEPAATVPDPGSASRR